MPANRTGKRAGRRTPDLWADTVEAPRADVTSPDRVTARTRFYRFSVWTAVVASPILLVLNVTSAAKRADPVVASSGAGQVTSPGRAVAQATVQSWLSQSPSPLPGGYVLAWTGSRTVTAGTTNTSSGTGVGGSAGGGIPPAGYEIDSFTLGTSGGVFYTASIEVAVDSRPGGGSKPVSGVSILPLPVAAQDAWGTSGPWPDSRTVKATDAVTSAVQAWATAWTSGNPTTLAQAVQDPATNHTYQPLYGVQSETTTILSTGSAPQPADRATAALASTMWVQTQISLVWPGQATPQPGGTGSMPTVLDLLVAHADTNAPIVVAWGPPGSAPSLTPYCNAIVNGITPSAPTTVAPSPGS